jgi:epoxyqueuosine reductase
VNLRDYMRHPRHLQPIAMDVAALVADIRAWSAGLGFDATRITALDTSAHVPRLQRWLDAGFHGEMAWLHTTAGIRRDPTQLLPGASRGIVVRLHYGSGGAEPLAVLADPGRGYIARYALGADYHKLMRRRLAQLARRIDAVAGPAGFRACVDSAPVLEKAFAEGAGLGWFGKHTLILHRDAGSLFCLGMLLTDLPLPVDAPVDTPAGGDACGACQRCIDVCPTGAIVAPRTLDARRCISYLTIEHRGSIPEPLRAAIGNRIFGCDDCQLHCPWNRHARPPALPQLAPRHGLDAPSLLELFAWDAATFLARTEGMALRRVSYAQWQRNVAVALGNAPHDAAIVAALSRRLAEPGLEPLVAEHVRWALMRQAAAAR